MASVLCTKDEKTLLWFLSDVHSLMSVKRKIFNGTKLCFRFSIYGLD